MPQVPGGTAMETTESKLSSSYDAHEAPISASLPLLAAADLQEHLMTASNDLDRLQDLLSHACETLMERFQGALQDIAVLNDGPRFLDGKSSTLEEALRNLSGAVTALQFQDMASQLIDHTHRRLRSCADRLAMEVMGNDEDGDCVLEALPLRPNPVTQSEMDAGSIELF